MVKSADPCGGERRKPMATRPGREAPGPMLTERYRALVDHSPHAVVELDGEGRIRGMNGVGLEWAGAEAPEEVIGAALPALAAEDDRARVEAALAKALRGDEVQFRYADEAGAQYATSLIPITEDGEVGHVLALTQNLTDELRLRHKFSEMEAHHSLILESAGEGVYGLDADGRLTFGNAAAERIVGWDTKRILGERSHEIHHHTYPDGRNYPREECPIYAALKDGQVHHVEDEVFWHSDGSAVPVEYTSTPIMKDGEPAGAVVIFRDISERKALEAQRREAFEEIKRLKEQLEQERDYLRDEVNVSFHYGEIIGQSEALKRTLAQLEAVAPTPANVLILGESGVGKEMIARAIHAHSGRADKPLVKVNCASIPKDLFESEFFGHVKGSFTGAHRDRVGRLQLADGGTLFLDEVGEIPLSQQGKLLRALQENEFEQVGDDETKKVDVRVVAATNRDLLEEVKAGRFREDLYYRLSVFPIDVPPLRERVVDIASLAAHFLKLIAEELGRHNLKLTREQLARLKRYDWPGNIRELKNVIERAAISSKGSRVRIDMALPETAELPPTAMSTPNVADFVTETEFRLMEKANIIAALRAADWRVWGENGAADLLGINPSTLKYRMKQLGIEKPGAAQQRSEEHTS